MPGPIVEALLLRRASISAALAGIRLKCEVATSTLTEIDGRILSLDPEADLARFRRRGLTEGTALDPWFRPREAIYMALDALKTAGRPMTTTELTSAILACKRAEATVCQFKKLNSKLSVCLQRKRREGVVRHMGRVQGANRSILWEVI